MLRAACRGSWTGTGILAVLIVFAGTAGAQPGPDEPPPPAADLGATGLGEPAEPEPGTAPGAEPGAEPGTDDGPLLPPSDPLLPPSGTTEPPVPSAGSVLIDAAALGELFREQPMYRAGLAAIVQNPPGAAETSAIPEVLADRDAFERLVGDFARYMDQFALDWYRRRERDVYRTFRQQSSTELDLRRRSRRAAIFYLEEFLRDHPDNPPYSPEAMYRLGDLYWEDEDETAGRELRAREFYKTIEIYKRLLTEYPDFGRRDGVYYVLGFSLNETMTPGFFDDDAAVGVASPIDPNKEEAVAAFLASVCSNTVRYPPYRGAVAGPHRVAGAPQWIAPAAVDPALAAREAPPPAYEEYRDLTDSATGMRDYFHGCRPLVPGSKFNAPTWFVVAKAFQGRYALEFNDENIEWSISAYRRVLDSGPANNPYYAIALAEIGHALSGMNRYDEAMEAYRLFLDKLFSGEFSDYQSTAERQKINVLIGISANLIYDYWLGARRSQTPAERVADREVVPQDAPYYQELLETLMGECCEDPSSKCDSWQKKAGVYRLFVERFPLHPKIPQILRKLVDLYRENAGDDDATARQDMLEAIECLALFRQSGGPGTGVVVASPVAGSRSNRLCPDPAVGQRWWEENRDNPELIQEAEEQAEGALQDAAAQYHAAAETHQANCDAGVSDSCILKDRMFELAIEAYRQLLTEYPSSAFTYDNMFNLGTCYYYLGRTDEALGQYETVERSTLATTRQRDALGNQITILGNNFLASGQALIPEEPPSHLEVDAEGVERRIPDPVPVPSLIARWQEAMGRWVQRYPSDPESLGYRTRIAGQLFYLGHWPEAQRMYEQLFNEYCGNAAQADSALEWWKVLKTLAGFAGDRERVGQLEAAAEEGTCFSSEAGQDEVAAIQTRRIGRQFRAANDMYEAAVAAAAAEDPNAPNLYREAARALLEVVAQYPDEDDTPAAIRIAAIAYMNAKEPVLAVETWKRVVEFCAPSGPHTEACAGEGPTDPNRVRLPEAYFYIAINARQTYDLAEAAQNYQALERVAGAPGRGERLRPYDECSKKDTPPCTDGEYVRESVRALADIRRFQGNWNEAARLTERILAEGYARPQEATQMRMDVIDFYRRASAWSDMRRAADDYLGQYQSDSARVLDILRVRWILYKDAERQRDRRALDRAIGLLEDAYNRLSATQKAVVSAGFDAAQAQLVIGVQEILGKPRFEALESKYNTYDRLQFEPRRLQTFGDDLGTFKDNLVRQAKELTVAYLAVIGDYPVSPTWGTAARYRISVIWNHLVLTLATLEQRLRPEWLDLQLPSGLTLRDLLDELAAGIRSVVVESGVTIDDMIRYYLVGDGSADSRNIIGAVVYARATGVSNEWVRSAIDLVRTLALTDDPSQLFANGRLPEVTGESLGGGLDPIAQ